MVYFYKAALVSDADELRGLRFAPEEDDDIYVDIAIERFNALARSNLDTGNYKELLCGMSNSGIAVGNDVELFIGESISDETVVVDSDLNAKEDRLPLITKSCIMKMKSSAPDLTQKALLNLGWMVYNTDFFDRFQVVDLAVLGVEADKPSIQFQSLYSRKVESMVYDAIIQFLKDLGTRGVGVAIVTDNQNATKKDQCTFALSVDLTDMDFGSLDVSGYQMNARKSTRAMISNSGHSVVVDEHGISFTNPDDFDLYDQPDVSVVEEKDLDPYQDARHAFIRFYQDMDAKLHILRGVKKDIPKVMTVANWLIVPNMKVTTQVLEEIRKDGVALPTVEMIDAENAKVTLRVPVDYSLFPVDVEEIQENIAEEFECDAYSQLAHPKLRDYNMLVLSGKATPVGDDAIDFSVILTGR